ncbi:Ribosomal RNA processing protein 36-like protein [Bienertia sinuspersici]
MVSARQCFEGCGLVDIPYGGHYFTWSNKQMVEDRVVAKLDRVMANEEWMDVFTKANVVYPPEEVLDHCPAIIRMDTQAGGGHKHFTYFCMWSNAQDYIARVKAAWECSGQGSAMFKLKQKFKRVKNSMKQLSAEGFYAIQAKEQNTLKTLLGICRHLHLSSLGVADD